MMNLSDVKFEASFGQPGQLPPCDRPEIAFCGRSNVGKSSMINKLFNRKSLARVSSVPGKTATVNFFSLGNIRFADLPGYGYAKVSKAEKQRWSKLMESYFTSDRSLSLVVLLLDIRHPPSADDKIMLEFLTESKYPFTILLTKADKLSKAKIEERLFALKQEIPGGEGLQMTPFSSKTGMGVLELREMIKEFAS